MVLSRYDSGWKQCGEYLCGLLAILLMPVAGHAKTCPGKAFPNIVNAIYIKYQITDELEISKQKSTGAPADVRGDELAEVIIWKEYRWDRLFGKIWNLDDAEYNKMFDSYHREMDMYLEKQRQGIDVSAEVEKLTSKLMSYAPEHKAYEYDRISVKTPKYSLEYNRSEKVGYGYFGVNVDANSRMQLNKKVRTNIDAFITSSFKNSDALFGIKRLPARQSSVLGEPCKREIFTTTFSDFEREYSQVESCTAIMFGHKIDLYAKMGKPGEQYILQAVEINKSYAVKKELFCSPAYVTMD